jgi:hypothetical protein
MAVNVGFTKEAEPAKEYVPVKADKEEIDEVREAISEASESLEVMLEEKLCRNCGKATVKAVLSNNQKKRWDDGKEITCLQCSRDFYAQKKAEENRAVSSAVTASELRPKLPKAKEFFAQKRAEAKASPKAK